MVLPALFLCEMSKGIPSPSDEAHRKAALGAQHSPVRSDESKASWAPLATSHKSRPLAWSVEKGIFLPSLSAILLIFLIFAFVGNKAWPIVVGKSNSSRVFKPIPVEEMAKHSPEKLQEYLGVTAAQWNSFDAETRRTLMEVK